MRTRDGLGAGSAGDFAALAGEYWNAFGDALRKAAGGNAPAPGRDAWQAGLDSWAQLLGAGASRGGGFGNGMGGGMGGPFGGFASAFDPSGYGQGFAQGFGAGSGMPGDLGEVVERFATQGRQWFAQMQQVAGQFAGRQAGADEIVQAWKQAMGQGGDNPFAQVFSQMSGRGHAGFEQWFAQVAPLLQAGWMGGLQQQGGDWLRLPAFGPNREHQERWQAFAQAQLALQQAQDGYHALLMQAGHDAFARFESKLAERSEPGRQLQSARALFDLWVDAAEEAYAEIALSPEFRQRYADLVNAQMRLRSAVQREIELFTAALGVPGRTEVDSAHRKIAELEREVRRLRRAATAPQRAPLRAVPDAASPAPPARAAAVAKPAPAKAADATPAAPPADIKAAAQPSAKAAAKPSTKQSVKPAAKRATKPAARAVAAKPAVSKPAVAKAAKPARAPAARASKRAPLAIAASIPQAPQPMSAAAAPNAAKAAKRSR